MSQHEEFTIGQVAEFWQVSARHVRGLIRDGALSARNISSGKRPDWRVTEADIRAFEERRTNPAYKPRPQVEPANSKQ